MNIKYSRSIFKIIFFVYIIKMTITVKITEEESIGKKPLKDKIVKYTKWHVTSPVLWNTIPDINDFVKIPCIEPARDILIVKELGQSNNEHWHMTFTSNKSRNTTNKQLEEFGFLHNKFSDPTCSKYNKYGEGSEYIYLLKGKTNHMMMSDDISVQPDIAFSNLNKNIIETYREKYINVLKELKEKKSDIKNFRDSNNKDIWEQHLIAVKTRQLSASADIVEYLLNWYEMPEHHFTKHSFQKWYYKLLKHCNIKQYRELINREIANIVWQPSEKFS